MRRMAETTIGSAAGLLVLTAMFIAIWMARDSSAGAGIAEADAEPPALQSARVHRTPVTRTSITPEQLQALREK